MDSNLTELNRKTDQIVDRMVNSGLVVKHYPEGIAGNESDFRLALPNSFERDLIGVICSGHPEKAGVWAHSILSKGLEQEASMASYFEAFNERNWGLIALNPHFNGPDDSGAVYQKQLAEVFRALFLNRTRDATVGIISFSQGGAQVLQFLMDAFIDRSEISQCVEEGLKSLRFAFIDTVPLLPFKVLESHKGLMAHVAKHSLVFSTTGEYNTGFGEVTAAFLGVEPVPVYVPHGLLPSVVLPQIIEFFSIDQDER